MKRQVMILGMLWAAATAAWGQSVEKKAEEPKPISALSWLVGGVWTADASKMSPGMRIETRYQWSDNNAYIRFTTHFVFDKGTAKTYDGNFFWNPAQKSLAMWYMDAKNGITEGPVEVSGEATKLSFHGPDFEGKEADLRVFVRRKTNDDYRWSVEEKQGEAWKEVVALEYLRTAGN
ncbi:MAG TPA: hypothetical protein VE077_03490 [Candidatus Methylomirabilis sp.]|nr:hypothetical protein [Candidatus Methylomirabilis sp.]